MEWNRLLCSDRIRLYSKSVSSRDLRSEFEKDYHRIISSASFRRLQDKTQVYPLDESDFVRTRLTHSLEVSSFCKSLGQTISRRIINELKDESFLPQYQQDICDILQCSGLIHDIGNPPYGHFGEDVIRKWFKENIDKLMYPKELLENGGEGYVPVSSLLNDQMKADFFNFEGNTQALRVVTKLHYLVDAHGMNLTKALLSTIIKYPVSSLEIDKNSDDIRVHKMGYYYADREVFDDIETSLGLNGNRSPLTLILEAADDTAYLTADIEDAFKKGLITYDQLLYELETHRYTSADEDNEYNKLIEQLKYLYEKGHCYGAGSADSYAIQNWIISVQGKLIYDATDSFIKNYDDIMSGNYRKELLDGTEGKHITDLLGDIAYRYAFLSKPKMSMESLADDMMSEILDAFIPAVLYYDTGRKLDEKSEILIGKISDNYKAIYHIYSKNKSEAEKLYLRLMLVTDYVCGMTDSYTKRLCQELKEMKK
ncbi:MAG: deoxyguanosinetriphosphate triphosphohydrolase [Butyrivibrio sp.]|nr:deoxyguanosinetriphosphate triphosphohydrolase [Butyrivibrio sp.]